MRDLSDRIKVHFSLLRDIGPIYILINIEVVENSSIDGRQLLRAGVGVMKPRLVIAG
jgi:hypothetical protein